MNQEMAQWGMGAAVALLVLDRAIQLVKASRRNGSDPAFSVNQAVALQLTKANVEGMVKSLQDVSESLKPIPEAMRAVLETSRNTLDEIRAHREGAKGLAGHIEKTILGALRQRRRK